MARDIKNIVIVGGGTAGWLVASRLSSKYQSKADCDMKITLVESANIPPVGVGEGTWPTMRSTLDQMGISESEFIRECDATFKQGSRFSGWATGKSNDCYYHPITLPQGYQSTNMLPHWQPHSQRISFSNAVSHQEQLCEKGLAPKNITTPEYAAAANYGYHLNAGKFSAFLKKHCMSNFMVEHIVDDVVQVNSAENGDIASVTTKSSGDIPGDLFVDCTGFACLLLGEHYKVPFINKLDTLFVDTALAVHVPYSNENSPIETVTNSTATPAGWIWDIGLINRRGVGHVYSSRHTTEAKAEKELFDYLGDAAKGCEITKIPVRPGHRERAWEKTVLLLAYLLGFWNRLKPPQLYKSSFPLNGFVISYPPQEIPWILSRNDLMRLFTIVGHGLSISSSCTMCLASVRITPFGWKTVLRKPCLNL